jgi:hypothetical protein
MRRTIHSILANQTVALATVAVVMNWLWLGVPSASGQKFDMTDEQFDQLLFRGNRETSSADSQIMLAIEAADRACQLSEAQKEKLRLAGRGDFARFQVRVDDLRAEYAGKSYDQNEIGNVLQKFQPLITLYQSGLLGRSSLFAKVLHQTLTPTQLEEYEGIESERTKQRYADKVRLFVAVLSESCPLKDDQREALVNLLLAETRPPKHPSQYDWYVVLAQAANISNEKYTAILDPAQMRVFKKLLNRGRGLAGFLKQQDLLSKP